MDAKAYPNLNPKLKETYDRIMGTSTTVKVPHPADSHSTKHPSPAHQTVARAAVPQASAPKAPSHLSHGQLTHIAYNASQAARQEKKVEEKQSEKEGSSLVLPIVLGVGGVIFFVVYSFFWLNFFGMN